MGSAVLLLMIVNSWIYGYGWVKLDLYCRVESFLRCFEIFEKISLVRNRRLYHIKVCSREMNLGANRGTHIDGYKNFWCHRENRIGGGVGILTSNILTITKLTSHIARMFSAVWILLHLLNNSVIIGCVYHPPNADNNATLNYLLDTMLKLLQKRLNTHFIVPGDTLSTRW